MRTTLPDWPRRHYVPGGRDAFLLYVVYGRVDVTKELSRSKYRCDGIPDGIEVTTYGPDQRPDVVAMFRHGYAWNEFVTNDPKLAATVTNQDSCLILRGQIPDPPSLNYLRDVVGVLTFSLDAGGVAIYDPQTLAWSSPADWRARIFDVDSAVPRHHVNILVSEEGDGTEWFHTRGLRKFGRPDLSIHKVLPQYREAITELCSRFIELLAFGGIVPEGQEIRMASLPSAMRCFHRGNADDPDFNNEHIEILWPVSVEESGLQ
jgi:hypothetical protein